MRNKVLLSSVLLACTASTYAGGMGPVESSYSFKPFLLGEAAYSWPHVNGMNVHSSIGRITSDVEVQGWGGRLAAGLTRQIAERFALSFEGGLIYNDHIALQPVLHAQGVRVQSEENVLDGSFDQYGFDLLGGINYTKPKYDLFFKAGALFENLRAKVSVNSHKLLEGNSLQSGFLSNTHQAINTNIGQVMPEIKLGGAYHFNEDWSITGAWMHAFGGSLAFNSENINLTTGSVAIGGISFDLNNPSLNSAMFGVQYNFS